MYSLRMRVERVHVVAVVLPGCLAAWIIDACMVRDAAGGNVTEWSANGVRMRCGCSVKGVRMGVWAMTDNFTMSR